MKSKVIMKMITFLLLSIYGWAVVSCNASKAANYQKMSFDEVVHYHYDLYKDPSANFIPFPNSLTDGSDIKQNDSIVKEVRFGRVNLLAEQSVLQKMESFGFEKKALTKSQLFTIDSILWNESGVIPNRDTVLVAYYSDILVFKHNDKIVAVLQICFECLQVLYFSSSGVLKDNINEEELTAIMFLLHDSDRGLLF